MSPSSRPPTTQSCPAAPPTAHPVADPADRYCRAAVEAALVPPGPARDAVLSRLAVAHAQVLRVLGGGPVP